MNEHGGAKQRRLNPIKTEAIYGKLLLCTSIYFKQ
jgi:hypothetical protein